MHSLMDMKSSQALLGIQAEVSLVRVENEKWYVSKCYLHRALKSLLPLLTFDLNTETIKY